MGRFVPPSAIVNAHGDIVYVFGRTGAYLEPASGRRPRMNIVEMARDDLQVYLGPALRQAAEQDTTIVHDNVRSI
jgi:two-component system CheB/CheR fusion protein